MTRRRWRHAMIPDGRNATAEEIRLAGRIRTAEREALRAMRNLADFDVLCARSEALIAADRAYRNAVRRATIAYSRRER